jgi:hypothetical protein
MARGPLDEVKCPEGRAGYRGEASVKKADGELGKAPAGERPEERPFPCSLFLFKQH